MYQNIDFDLSMFSVDDGIHLVSTPQTFPGGEEAYDAHIGGSQRDDLLRSGQGAWHLLTGHITRPIDNVLEVGAGGGTCSLGLIASALKSSVLITDTSVRFLRLIQSKLAATETRFDSVEFATLAGEDLRLLPSNSFDAIVIASALHHVSDWQEFLRNAARIIRPRGALVIQEPCREGNLMMGMAVDIALSPLWPKEMAFEHDDVERMVRCRDSIFYLANSRLAKFGEDKHSFLATQLAAAGHAAGFSHSVFYSNFHFCDLLGHDLAEQQGRCSLLGYLESFLGMHHGVSQNGIAKLRSHLFPILQRLDSAFIAGDGAPLLGCMVFCR